jgi:TonB family protein
MKIILSLLSLFLFIEVSAQSGTNVKYYDSTGKICEKMNATYYAELIKKDSIFELSKYYAKSNKLCGRASSLDSTFRNRQSLIGNQVVYYEDGKVRDSIFWFNNGKSHNEYEFYSNGKIEDSILVDDVKGTVDRHDYYQNGKLDDYVFKDYHNKISKTEGYDSTGKIIPVGYEKEAEFPGGDVAWKQYLVKNLRREFSRKLYKNEEQVLKVVVKFIVSKDGTVSDVKIEKSSNVEEVDDDALKVIQNSPKWNNGNQNNRPVNSYRLQPLTYVLEAK